MAIQTNKSISAVSYNGTNIPLVGSSSASIEPNKNATPSTSQQEITPSSGYDALAKVTVAAIQTETKSTTINGTVTPTSGKYLSQVTVNVPQGIPIEISTDAGMTAVLTSANVGKSYKFTGTTGTYVNGDIYIVEES